MADEKAPQARDPNPAVLPAKDANIDRHTCRRIVPMQVLSLGMPRTGTCSMKAALEILGYKHCYHSFDIDANVRDLDMWAEACAAKYEGKGKFGRAEFDQLLGHCMAVTDAPCSTFAAELIDAYPDAKVILVERDIEAWYRSFNILMELPFIPWLRLVALLDPSWTGKRARFWQKWLANEFGATTLEKAQEVTRARYRAHNATVRRVAPKERFLDYELGSGWEPLCKFLGKQVPDVPFPRLNEATELKKTLRIMQRKNMRRALHNVAGGLGLCIVVVCGSYYWWNRRV
ncbi:P-loop containing nucleoside triphosphate hydrolase protein [Roridomyces roridus]|uniref:P-loop containing nucleoside triphosphate hydrolase protein n=1 Tax=Roridomyces roridus TaxID=1738132 RepID=A0AAD7F7E3_9AGAR|nr:P-loop containing nucleoside triphosphate hydrolase protein [Roridomyces roridus]